MKKLVNGINEVITVFKFDHSNLDKRQSLLIQFLYLIAICTLILMSFYVLGSTRELINHQAFDQHHFTEFEDAVFLCVFLSLAVIESKVIPMRAMRQQTVSIFPSPQLPPPK